MSKERKIIILERPEKCQADNEQEPKKRTATEHSYVITENTGINSFVNRKILSEYNQNASQTRRVPPTPKKRKLFTALPLPLEEADKTEIRQLVYSFFRQNELPTLDKLEKKLEETRSFTGVSQGALSLVLQQLQFKIVKQNCENLIIERPEIACARRNYLRNIKTYREQNRPIFYLDETSFSVGIVTSRVWIDKSLHSTKDPLMKGLLSGMKESLSTGPKVIVLHIGNENGFLEDEAFFFHSEKTENYPEDMSADTFEEWFQQILPDLPPQSVIVLDNAPYHSRIRDKIPTTNSTKLEILQWLERRNISCDSTMIRAELLKLVAENKDEKSYIIDEMAEEMNHTVLRLPPFHNELSPIELVWADIKSYVAKHNSSCTLNDIETIFAEARRNVSVNVWAKCVHYIRDVSEPKMWELDILIDKVVEPLIDTFDFNDAEEVEEDS